MKMKRVIFVLTLFSIAISCKEEPIKTEQQLVVDYLLANGFTLRETNSSKASSKRIFTMEEAKKVLNEIKFITESYEGSIVKTDSKTSAKVSLIACEDAGTYYISRAIDGAISGVDISYRINEYGYIGDIVSYSTGLILAWSWDQIGVNVLNPRSSFCISGVITYGIEIGGVPLGYSKAVALRVTLRGCDYQVAQTWGPC
jgi:hypothetical protein